MSLEEMVKTMFPEKIKNQSYKELEWLYQLTQVINDQGLEDLYEEYEEMLLSCKTHQQKVSVQSCIKILDENCLQRSLNQKKSESNP